AAQHRRTMLPLRTIASGASPAYAAIAHLVPVGMLSMARSAILSFNDPISYQAAIPGTAAEIVVTAKGSFRAHFTVIQFDKLCIYYASENRSRVAHSALSPKRGGIAFLTDANQPARQYCEMDLSPDALVNSKASMYAPTRAW